MEPASGKRLTQVCAHTHAHKRRHTRTASKHMQPEAAHEAGIRFKLPNKTN